MAGYGVAPGIQLLTLPLWIGAAMLVAAGAGLWLSAANVLYRDVPYRMMAPMRRSQIHQRIAERGVAIYGDHCSEIAAELAMHFEQSRDWPRAVVGDRIPNRL